MAGKAEYFVLREKAIPEVLLKVVEAKRLLDLGKAASVQEAADAVGIIRSSSYMDEKPGLLSVVLKSVADYQANVLTIHQSIPVGGVASLTISVEVLPDTGDISRMVEEIEGKTGVHYLKILARE